MKNKVIYIFLFLIIIIAALMYYKIQSENLYEKSLGFPVENYKYGQMIKDFGTPQYVVSEKVGEFYTVLIRYDELGFKFLSVNGKDVADNAVAGPIYVYSKKFKFRNGISVGSSFEDVIKAYSEVRKSPDGDGAYIDEYTRVKFLYSNNVVNEIVIVEVE